MSKRYRIRFCMDYVVYNYDPLAGTDPNTQKLVRSSTTTCERVAQPTIDDLASFLADKVGRLDARNFKCVSNDEGKFIFKRLEDKNGNDDPHGDLLAFYTVQIECDLIPPPERVGTLGLPIFEG